MGWESRILRSELQGLQFNDRQTSGRPGTGSTVLVEFSDSSFHLISPGDLSGEELDYVCGFLCDQVRRREEREVEKQCLLHAVLSSVASQTYDTTGIDNGSVVSQKLKSLINQYFTDGLDCEALSLQRVPISRAATEIGPELANQISRDVHSLVAIHSDRSFNGRAIARIFQGIPSPCFPAEVWGKQQRFWRRYLDVDFNLLCRMATNKLLELR